MTVTGTPVPDQAFYWFVVQHTSTPDEEMTWTNCITHAKVATHPGVVADDILGDHGKDEHEWTRVTVYANVECTGEPVYQTSPFPTGVNILGAQTMWPLAPAPEEGADAQSKATHAPPGTRWRSWSAGAAEARADTSAQRSALRDLFTKGAKDRAAGRPPRVHVTLEGDAAEEVASMMHTMAGLQRVSMAEEAEHFLKIWATALDGAIPEIDEMVQQDNPEMRWYHTEAGLLAMAATASGFLAAFQRWKIYH